MNVKFKEIFYLNGIIKIFCINNSNKFEKKMVVYYAVKR